MAIHDTTPRSRLSQLEEASETFYSRFIRIGAIGLGTISFGALVGGLIMKQAMGIVAGGIGVALHSTAFVLSRGKGGILGRRIFVYGMCAIGLISALAGSNREQIAVYTVLAGLLATTSGFALRRVDLYITSVLGVLMVCGLVAKVAMQDGWSGAVAMTYLPAIGLVLVQIVSVFLFTNQTRGNQRKLETYVDEVDRLIASARRVAGGDLTGKIEGEGEVSEAIRAMVDGLRTLVARAREVAAALSSSAQEIAAMARQQEQGAVEQASAVTQIHKTLATLLEGSNHAAQSTEEVFRNVELTQTTSETVAQRAAALSAHTRRISAILEIIKNIANKSEILALNAALEGARAGEAGRGFSLVASQMQRLAESVMDSVRDVRALVEDIEAATAATLAATEESTQLSAKATSATKQISVSLQRQRGSTEQVAAAMHDIQHVATQVSVGSSQSLSATKDLTRLAAELTRAIEGFQL